MEAKARNTSNAIKDIWSLAIDKRKKGRLEHAICDSCKLIGIPYADGFEQKRREASVVFAGPRQSGKSTLFQSYISKDQDKGERAKL